MDTLVNMRHYRADLTQKELEDRHNDWLPICFASGP